MTAQPLPTTRLEDDGAAAPPRPVVLGRRAAVVALLVGATLNLTEALIGRVVGQSGDVAESLDAWAAQPTLARTGLALGTVAVPFLLLAVVAMAQVVRPRMPRLGATATVLAYLGGLGFFGIHAVSVIDAAAADQPDRDAMVAVIEAAQNSALGLLIVVPFMIGLLGAVLLASIGMLRTRVVHWWIPATLLLFLVLDFGPVATGPVDPHWLFFAASVGLAVAIARRTDREWWLGAGIGRN